MPGPLVILHFDRNAPPGKVDVPHIRGFGLFSPGIQEQMVVDPEAAAVIHGHREAVHPGREVQVAGPADGELVLPDARRGGAQAPVKVDAGVIPDQGRASRQGGVVIVFTAPVGDGRRGDLPGEADDGIAGPIVEFHNDEVMPRAEGPVHADGLNTVVVPLVDDQRAVQPDAHAVIAGGGEAVGGGG